MSEFEKNQIGSFVLNPGECNILVVDDSENVAELVVAMLSTQKYRVDSTPSAAAALNLIKSAIPDLVITDLMMPEMDGFEFIRQVRQIFGQMYVPIVMFTASNNEQDRVKALHNGADDFVTKPINRHELQARVRNLLRLKKSLDSLSSSLQDRDRLLQEVTTRYLELEATQSQQLKIAAVTAASLVAEADNSSPVSSQKAMETMLTTIRAIHNQLQQPVHVAQAYIDLASQKNPGRELELARAELERINQMLQGLEEAVRTGGSG